MKNIEKKAQITHLAKDRQQRMVYLYNVPESVDYALLLTPSYWSNIAVEFQVGDELIVHPQDMAYYARLLVVSAERRAVKMYELQKVNIRDNASSDEDGEYIIKWRRKGKNSIIRTSDNEVIKSGFDTKQAASEYLETYLESIEA